MQASFSSSRVRAELYCGALRYIIQCRAARPCRTSHGRCERPDAVEELLILSTSGSNLCRRTAGENGQAITAGVAVTARAC